MRLLSASCAGMVLLQQNAPEDAHDAPPGLDPSASESTGRWAAGTAPVSDVARTRAMAASLDSMPVEVGLYASSWETE